jgi:hypothetical protein
MTKIELYQIFGVKNIKKILIGNMKGRVYFGKLSGDGRIILVWTVDK